MIGANVDEIVDAKVAQVLAVGSKLFGCDPVVVGVGEAPGFVEGTGGLIEPVAAGLEAVDGLVVDLVGIDAGFSLPLLAGGGNFIVAEGDIVVGTVSETGVDETVGLKTLDRVVDVLTLLGADGHGHVEPSQGNVAVIGHDLLDLGENLAFKADGVVLFGLVGEIPAVFHVTPAHLTGSDR